MAGVGNRADGAYDGSLTVLDQYDGFNVKLSRLRRLITVHLSD